MAVTYTVRWREVGSDGAWGEEAGLTTTSFTIAELAPGVRYDVQVEAVGDDGSRATIVGQRRTVCAAPAAPAVAPAGFRVTAGPATDTDGAVDVGWTAVTGADYYVVQHRTADAGSGAGAWSAGTSTAGTALRIGGLATDGGAAYDVRVAAVNDEADRSADSTPTTGASPLIATGGSVAVFTGADGIGTDGVVYVVHAFAHDPGDVDADRRTQHTMTFHRSMSLDCLAVGGGGGGGGHIAGGGGAGEVVTGTVSVTVTTTPVTGPIAVGGGGEGGLRVYGVSPTGDLRGDGGDGSDSRAFDGPPAVGGGGGGNVFHGGRTGGSGGGAGSATDAGAGSTVADGVVSRGSAGGAGAGSGGVCEGALAGGGGGAGASGGAARTDSQDGGDGGDGIPVTLMPDATGQALGVGVVTESGLMIGGGGGGGVNAGTECVAAGGPGAGGAGGGGTGGQNSQAGGNAATAGAQGTDGTGGGGGGASGDGTEDATATSGGRGGHGVVAVRYAIPAPA